MGLKVELRRGDLRKQELGRHGLGGMVGFRISIVEWRDFVKAGLLSVKAGLLSVPEQLSVEGLACNDLQFC